MMIMIPIVKKFKFKQNSSPNFDSIKYNIYLYINKNIPKEIEFLEDF